MSFDWKKTLATVAPTVATALGGPLAGVAVKLATDALGVETSEAALQEAIASNDPGILLKLKQVESDFIVKLEALGVERERIAAGDRSSARSLFRVNIWPQIVLSTVFIVGYFVVLGLLLSGEISIPEAMNQMAMLLLGMLAREASTIMQFWFGSSSGSKEKTASIVK